MRHQYIQLMKKRIDLDASPILYNTEFSEQSLAQDWDRRAGEWTCENGWATGRHGGNSPGMIISRHDYFGDVIVEFEARTVLPSTHDINVMWNGSWDEATNTRETAYVAGLQGWWEGKVGIEKSPEYRFMCGTGLFDFVPGRIYRIVAGSIAGHCFILADDRLLLEAMDPDPIDSTQHGRVGFEAYCSWIQVRKPLVRQIKWEAFERQYEAEW